MRRFQIRFDREAFDAAINSLADWQREALLMVFVDGVHKQNALRLTPKDSRGVTRKSSVVRVDSVCSVFMSHYRRKLDKIRFLGEIPDQQRLETLGGAISYCLHYKPPA